MRYVYGCSNMSSRQLAPHRAGISCEYQDAKAPVPELLNRNTSFPHILVDVADLIRLLQQQNSRSTIQDDLNNSTPNEVQQETQRKWHAFRNTYTCADNA